ncbi:MAG: hypothetical protein AB7H85_11050 [Dehalococcoidia bacterium]
MRRWKGATTLRAGVLALALASMAGTAAELAMERHWNSPVKLVPWFALGALLAIWPVATWVPRAGRWVVWGVCVAVVGVSGFGVYEHILENHTAGPLDFRYAARWDSMPTVEQWWQAATKGVGPAPVLAAGVLTQSACLIALATLVPVSTGCDSTKAA